jgi:S-DNA-T family DNA segregation ATPase FtsK/SpoIIIE
VRIAAKSVSREHCAIERNGDGLTIRDLGSTTGTYLGDDRITSVPIRDGLEVVVGPAVLRFLEYDT